jgi:molecular chaperone GrpE
MTDTPNTTGSTDATELEAIRTKLNATELELNNYKLRLADFENARKRLLRDAETERKYATESLARDLLAPLDNLDRALSVAKSAGDSGPLVAGVSATASQFLDVLRRHGVKRIECPPGTAFDPNLHQAVMEQPTADFDPGQIVQVLEQGFLLHDRVLRAASVIVASAAS